MPHEERRISSETFSGTLKPIYPERFLHRKCHLDHICHVSIRYDCVGEATVPQDVYQLLMD